jgi:hypothetical protein
VNRSEEKPETGAFSLARGMSAGIIHDFERDGLFITRTESDMEFKKKVRRKRKAQHARNRKAAGLTRVKVRGAKRWMKTAKVVEK